MIKKTLALTFAVLLILINIPTQAFAQSTTITKTIRVGYVENYCVVKTPTFQGYEGFGYEYLYKILEYTDNNYTLEFIQVDWSDGLQMLREGKLDLLAPAHYDISREEDFIYSKNEFAVDTTFLASTDVNNVATSSYKQLEGCTIGFQKDNIVIQTLKEILDENNVTAHIVEDTIETYDKEVAKQKYDYVVVNSLHMIADMQLSFNLGTEPTYLITSKDNQQLMNELDIAMERLNNKEYLFKELLYLKYFNHNFTIGDYISKEEFDLLQSQKVYTVGVTNLYTSFGFFNNSQIVGTAYDVMQEIANIANIKVEFVELDNNMNLNDISNLDFYFTPIGYKFETDDVESDHYISFPLLVIESLENNDNNTIGVLNNTKYTQEFIDYFLPNQKIIVFDNILALTTAFAEGGVDNLFLDKANYNFIFNKIIDVNHTVKTTNISERPTICFNENFSQEKIEVINKLLSYIDDEFIQNSFHKNQSALTTAEKLSYYQKYTRMFIVCLCVASFILFRFKKLKDKSFAELSTHDDLTGLLTLNQFIEETRTLLDVEDEQNYTIVSLDIDNFKYINEIYNYEVGSNILIQISSLIKNYLDESLPMCRALADNFIIVAKTEEFLKTMESFLHPDNEILDQINKHIDEHYIINFSIGSYNIIDKSHEVSYMIDCANLARSFSKMELGTTFNTFSEDMKEQEKVKNNIIAHMNQALIDKEFVLYYQPKFDIKTMKTTGAEALVRWFADGKMVPPNNFIPLFEKNGFIENLDYYVVERACEFIAVNDKIDLPKISVNLSGITIMKKDVVDKVMEIVIRHKIKPAQLDLEITESAFVDHFETALDSIDQFRELGFTISMDDFGAGISSLNRLKEISIDILKIDREFIVGSLENDKGSKIIRNIVNMAKDLKLETVAEGIETDEQLEFLRNLGCDVGQGYYFSRPLPEKDFINHLYDEK